MSKSLGWILLVLGLAIAGYGVAEAAGQTLPTGGLSPMVAWASALTVGLVFLVIALVLVTRTPKMGPAQAPPPAPAPPPETVEVKRTEMQWGQRQEPESAATSEIESARQQLARLKVQYGLGEISAESFRRLSQDLEAKLAELERAQLEKR